jgi:adenine-specific DNA-methyltransferase
MDKYQNHLHHGECLNFIQNRFDDLKKQFQLIYIDPPFLSGTRYSRKTRSQDEKDVAAKVEDIPTYDDRWEGMEDYLSFMKPRLEKMRNLLTENGSLWVHLDWHVSHYVKTLLDDIFGYTNFVNEIVWKRTNSPKTQSKGFGTQHDVILLYAFNSQRFQLNPVHRSHDERSLKPYSYKDTKGKFRLIEIEAQGIQRTEGRRQFEWRGRTAPYLYRKETLDKWWKDDLIYRSRNGRYTKKQYLADTLGVPVSDLWFDIPPVQGSSLEYTGFLTQKPEALLERVILSATNIGDLVGDFFAGTGTTAIVAQRLSRRWLLCEEIASTVEIINQRIQSQGMTVDYTTSSA